MIGCRATSKTLQTNDINMLTGMEQTLASKLACVSIFKTPWGEEVGLISKPLGILLNISVISILIISKYAGVRRGYAKILSFCWLEKLLLKFF